MTVSRTGRRFRRLGALVAVGVIATTLTACGGDDDRDDNGSGGGGGGDDYEVKLGYFPNLTHASAIVGIEKGFFEDKLDEDGATLKTLDFNSGSDTIDALLDGDLDATYIGPSPAITAYATSQNVSLICGCDVRRRLARGERRHHQPEDLEGKTLATPGLANTQDVALKYWLRRAGLRRRRPTARATSLSINQDNSLTVQAFKQGEIDGAWVPEPYASQLVAEGGAVLVDEADLWPDGQFVTTHLLVNNDFLNDHPDLVDDLLEGRSRPTSTSPTTLTTPRQLVGDYIAKLTGGEIPADALDPAWSHLTFTNDPIADSLIEERRPRCRRRSARGRSTTSATSTTSTHSTSCSRTRAKRKCQDHTS